LSGGVVSLHRYPVKGCGGEALAGLALAGGATVPGDRRYAFVSAAEAGDGWRPKTRCLTLMDEPALARFAARWNQADGTLVISRDGAELAAARAEAPEGRAHLAAAMSAALGRTLALIGAGADPALADSRDPVISILNLESLRALERETGRPLDPVRFRANVVFDGHAPWAEMGWARRTLALGAARLVVVEPIERCAATHVNPATAARDANLVRALDRGFGHACMGVYARVVAGGAVGIGAALGLA
jgi:uncharacterized protein